jgi:hypothetical protein
MAQIGDGKLVSRDFKVYFSSTLANTVDGVWDAVAGTAEATTLAEYIALTALETTKYTLDALLALKDLETGGTNIFWEIGELRKDGYVCNLEDGDTIEGNTKGDVLTSQAGSIALTQISLSKAFLDELQTNDGNDVCVFAVSTDGDEEFLIFNPDIRLNYNPSFTGGEFGMTEITFTKDVACGSDWSTVFKSGVAS